MGLFTKGKKVSRYVFVTMPLSIFGINQLRMGNRFIADIWTSLKNPTCPSCENGVMQASTANQDDQVVETNNVLVAWHCSHCNWGFLEENNLKKIADICARARAEVALRRLEEIDHSEREKIARSHQMHSRCCYALAVVILCGFIYLIASGARLIIAFNWFMFAITLSIFGLKRSYRYFQIQTNTLFIKGAFWRWLRFGKWFV